MFIYTGWTFQYVSKKIMFSRLLKGLISGREVFENFSSRNFASFISSVVSDLLNQLKITWQLYLISDFPNFLGF